MNGAFIFVGCILVSIGIGRILGYDDAVLIGLGVGFILWGLVGGRGFGFRIDRDRHRKDDHR